MTTLFTTSDSRPWKESEKTLFKFIFIYLLLQTIPLDWKFYRDLFSINWTDLYYGDIFTITRYFPRFFSGNETFADWLILIIIAAIGAMVWRGKYETKIDYEVLYYWLRVIVRYRLAIGILGYGMIKLFPAQAPFPSISNLNTNYGDFHAWKLFSLSLGIVPGYESFLGGVEVLAGLLLLFRRTASVGALIILIFTGNVFISNLAYEGGEYVYSFYLITLALFVFAHDAQRIYNLISLERPTSLDTFKPEFVGKLKSARLILKSLVIFFFVFLYGYRTYSEHISDPYQFPVSQGLDQASGLYNVSEFRINNKILPYSLTDSVRWKDVVFEKWATISIRSNRPVVLDSTNAEKVFRRDKDRNYELAGSGGRHYYSYTADTISHVLSLENKNKNYDGEKLTLNYSRPDSVTIILSGTNENKDSLYVVLNKIHKQYPVKLGRRGTLKL
jgi:hypothetical protein